MNKSKCNVIIVSDKNGNLLMCKRQKDPFIGLYNFVGGKEEKNESPITSAYRELFEETGISRKEVKLQKLLRVERRNSILDVFIGTLRYVPLLREEKNPLRWFDKSTDFANIDMFAGNGDVNYFINLARAERLIPKV